MRKLQAGHASLVIVLLSTLFLAPLHASGPCPCDAEGDIAVVRSSHSYPIPVPKSMGKGPSDGSDNDSTPGTSPAASTALHTPLMLSDDDEGGDRSSSAGVLAAAVTTKPAGTSTTDEVDTAMSFPHASPSPPQPSVTLTDLRGVEVGTSGPSAPAAPPHLSPYEIIFKEHSPDAIAQSVGSRPPSYLGYLSLLTLPTHLLEGTASSSVKSSMTTAYGFRATIIEVTYPSGLVMRFNFRPRGAGFTP